VASVKTPVFWYVAPCSLKEFDPLFGGAVCLMMEAVRSSVTSVKFCETSQMTVISVFVCSLYDAVSSQRSVLPVSFLNALVLAVLRMFSS
jgi:hypothetical protein